MLLSMPLCRVATRDQAQSDSAAAGMAKYANPGCSFLVTTLACEVNTVLPL